MSCILKRAIHIKVGGIQVLGEGWMIQKKTIWAGGKLVVPEDKDVIIRAKVCREKASIHSSTQ